MSSEDYDDTVDWDEEIEMLIAAMQSGWWHGSFVEIEGEVMGTFPICRGREEEDGDVECRGAIRGERLRRTGGVRKWNAPGYAGGEAAF